MRQSVSASISTLQGLPFIPLWMRARILRWYGVSCPPDIAIYEGVYFSSNRVVFGQVPFRGSTSRSARDAGSA